MAFTVTGATRGHIDLRDGDLVAYVAGEGLIPQDPRQPCYVVYLNAIDILQGKEERRPATEAEKAAITDAITTYFAPHVVAFE